MNTLCDAGRSMLVVIDLQERLMPAIHEGGLVTATALKLVQAARLLGVPVTSTVQNPERLGTTDPEIRSLCDSEIQKMDFDACAVPAFLSAIDTTRDDIILLGCEAHVCVLQTVLGLQRRNWRVRVVADAIGSRNPIDKKYAIRRMQHAGAEMVTAEMVMFEWMRSCAHPQFRDVLELIK